MQLGLVSALLIVHLYMEMKQIGEAFQSILDGGVSRDELFITSKVWNDMHGEDK